MQVRTSYFYQIRHFKKNMIPMSTAIWDPKWFHDNKGPDHIFTDRRGILNGLRLQAISKPASQVHCGCPCEDKDPSKCPFLQAYRFELNLIDFDRMYKGMEAYCNEHCKKYNIEEEPIAVLIVYETPDNQCSERDALQKLFLSHGIECKELEYPIQKPILKF